VKTLKFNLSWPPEGIWIGLAVATVNVQL